MSEGWISDFETLFAKCATDADYRDQLSEALQTEDSQTVGSLLDAIGVAGGSPGERSARIQALMEARTAMVAVSAQFGPNVPRPFSAP